MFMTRLFDLPKTTWTHPLAEFDRMRREMNALSGLVLGRSATGISNSAGVFPLLNITENQDNYFVRAELPGIKPEALEILITGKKLTISGERKPSRQADGVKYHRRERDAGRFSRIVELPGDVDSEKVVAKAENGVLTVTVPKAQNSKPRQITIH